MRRHDLPASLLLALEQGDDLALAGLLNPDVRMVVDSGDTTGGALRGRARVARALAAMTERHPDAALEVAHVNGGPGLVLRHPESGVVGVLSISVGSAGTIDQLWLSTAPGKLASWNRE